MVLVYFAHLSLAGETEQGSACSIQGCCRQDSADIRLPGSNTSSFWMKSFPSELPEQSEKPDPQLRLELPDDIKLFLV